VQHLVAELVAYQRGLGWIEGNHGARAVQGGYARDALHDADRGAPVGGGTLEAAADV